MAKSKEYYVYDKRLKLCGFTIDGRPTYRIQTPAGVLRAGGSDYKVARKLGLVHKKWDMLDAFSNFPQNEMSWAIPR